MTGSPQAGWYDDGHGTMRWWDGSAWTAHTQPREERPNKFMKTASQLGRSLVAQSDPSADPAALWSAVGKPLSGIGGGRYKLTSEYLYFERGTLSTKSQQIRTHEIYDVDASQTMTQKARGVGSIVLFARRSGSGMNERVEIIDVDNFRDGVAALNAASHDAREALRIRERTQTVNYSSQAPSGVVSATPEPAAGAFDLNAELAKLAAYRDQGILDEVEFAAAKRKLLGL